MRFSRVRNLPGVRTPNAAGSLRLPAETCLSESRRTPLRAGGDEIGKGKDSSLSRATKYWSACEIQLRRSTRTCVSSEVRRRGRPPQVSEQRFDAWGDVPSASLAATEIGLWAPKKAVERADEASQWSAAELG